MLYVYIISTLSLIFIIKLYYFPIPSFLSSINNRRNHFIISPLQLSDIRGRRWGRNIRYFMTLVFLLVITHIGQRSWQLIHCKLHCTERERRRSPEMPVTAQHIVRSPEGLTYWWTGDIQFARDRRNCENFYYLQWNSIKKVI